jgi:tetratricopeptide (TPR) repeat protein
VHRKPSRVRLWIRATTAALMFAVPPFVATWLVSHSDSISVPAAWLSLAAGVVVGAAGTAIGVWVLGRRSTSRLVPQELPAVTQHFLGRTDEVDSAVTHLRAPATGPRVVVISGPPGIGKTAFALQVAHRVAADFPDGGLFATLDARDRDPDEVVRLTLVRFLRALGHPVERNAAGLDQCRLAFQQVSGRKRLLVVLDDVNRVDPRALIPSGSGSATLITGPGPLTGIGAHLPLTLGPLSEADAVGLLAHIVGETRVTESRAAAVALAQACAGLPLALQMAGQALVARPSADMSVVVSRTGAGVRRPERPEPQKWALDVSYQLLTTSDRAAVRSLGRLDRRFEPWMLAQETDLDEDEARSLADRLSATQFVERSTSDAAGVPVYETVENVKEFARLLRPGAEEPEAHYPPRVRDPLDEQQIQAYDLLDKGELISADLDIRELLVRARANQDRTRIGKALASLAELRAELGGTDEVVDLAEQAWQYDEPGIRARVYRVMGHIQRRVRQLEVAENNLVWAGKYAEDAGDVPEQIRILTERALVCRLSDQPHEALEHTAAAMRLALSRRNGGIRYRPRILLAEGLALTKLRRWDQAGQRFAEARDAAGDAGFLLWLHWVDYREAQMRRQAGAPQEAQELTIGALAGFTTIRHRYGTGHCRLLLGRIHYDAEQFAAARTVIEDALETFRNCGDRFIEGQAAADLASVHLAEGSLDDAAIALQRAKQLKTGQRYWRTTLRLREARIRRFFGSARAADPDPVTTTSTASL